ncbi:MAG TPA: multidrug efflux SMR transporter [Candidatus Bathyarchaeia archaeon]|nr:multidrug efflux SMR transporter [Candidatus Bathyarchaeia archaeon]
MSWIYMMMAICLEVAGTTSMKLSHGMSKPIPTVLMIVFYLGSLGSLSLALKQLEVGTAYAVWSGVGTALIAVIGFLFFHDQITWQKGIAIGLIIAGCVLLNLNSGMHGEASGKTVRESSSVAMLGDREGL